MKTTTTAKARRVAHDPEPGCLTCGSPRTDTGAVCRECGGRRFGIVSPSGDADDPPDFADDSTIERAAFGASPRAPRGRDDGTSEFMVMQTIGNALAGLPDVESRARVMRWAAECFRLERAASHGAVLPEAAPPARIESDPSLALDGFDPFTELPAPAAEFDPAARRVSQH